MPGILGIDPGINGACALFIPGAEQSPSPESVFDIPTVGDGHKREIDGAQLAVKIWNLKPDWAFVEIINAFMPQTTNPETGEKEVNRWGGTSLFRFGGAYYSILTVLSCLHIPTRRVPATQWQADFNLQGKAKSGTDAARQVVLQRYPGYAQFVSLKKHQHRAEGILIGAHGARKMRREGENLDIPE